MLDTNYAQLIESTSQMFADSIARSENWLERLDVIEFEVKELIRRIGLQICEKFYNMAAHQSTEVAKEPGLWVKRKSTVTYDTLFGPVSVVSYYLYNETTGQSKAPTREALEIEGKSRSLALERALTDFGAESSFQRASGRFYEHYGWKIGQSTVRTVTLDYACQAQEYVEKTLQVAREAFARPIVERPGVSELLVELDGCEIRTCKLKGLPGRAKSPKRKLPKKKREISWKEARLGFCREMGRDKKKSMVWREEGGSLKEGMGRSEPGGVARRYKAFSNSPGSLFQLSVKPWPVQKVKATRHVA